MKTAVITGSGGFLGRHLCLHLLDRGYRVVGLGRTGSNGAGYCSTFLPIPVPPTTVALADILARCRPHAVFHLAGATSAPRMEDLRTVNVRYAAAVLDACAGLARPPKVVLAGSAAEYGTPERADGRVIESDTCRPTTPYGVTKLAQTCLGLAAAERGLPVVVARMFNVIGTGSGSVTAPGAFVERIARLAPLGGTLTTGPLHAVRDFIAADVATGTLAALAEMPETDGKVINVCSGHGQRMADLVDRLVSLAPYPVMLRLDPALGGGGGIPAVIGDNRRLAALGISAPRPRMDVVLAAMLRAAGITPVRPEMAASS